MYSYTAYGLALSSELALGELAPAPQTDAPDVAIRFAGIPMEPDIAADKQFAFQATPGEFMLHVASVADFFVRDGKQIIIRRAAGVDSGHPDLRLYLLGSVFGALLQQRGFLVLHGAAVLIRGKGVLFTGRSTAGKSTLAAALQKKGYAILTDDVCAVSLGSDQIPRIHPGFPGLKLCRDAAEKLNENIGGLEPLSVNLDKYRVGVRLYHASDARLDEIYILDAHDEPGVRIDAVTGANKLSAMIRNTYRYCFLDGPDQKSLHFRQCAAAAQKVNIYRVMRPKAGFAIDALADAVERNVLKT